MYCYPGIFVDIFECIPHLVTLNSPRGYSYKLVLPQVSPQNTPPPKWSIPCIFMKIYPPFSLNVSSCKTINPDSKGDSSANQTGFFLDFGWPGLLRSVNLSSCDNRPASRILTTSSSGKKHASALEIANLSARATLDVPVSCTCAIISTLPTVSEKQIDNRRQITVEMHLWISRGIISLRDCQLAARPRGDSYRLCGCALHRASTAALQPLTISSGRTILHISFQFQDLWVAEHIHQ